MRHSFLLFPRLLRLDRWLQGLRPYQAAYQTFKLLWPFILIQTVLYGLETSVFAEDGFFENIYHISTWCPFYQEIGLILTDFTLVLTYLIALLLVFSFSQQLADRLHDDGHLVGGCALFVLLLLNFNTGNATADNPVNLLSFNPNDFKSILLCFLVSLAVVYSYHGIQYQRQRHARRKVAPSTSTILPISVILCVTLGLSYLLEISKYTSITDLFNQLFTLPLGTLKNSGLIFLGSLGQNLLSFLGGSGVLDSPIQNISDPMGVANLNHALSLKSLANPPYPFTWHTLYETYGCFGGRGMTFALIIVLILVAHKSPLKRTAQLSLLPGLVNLNQPLLFGLPILLNPILFIPYLLAPIVSMAIAWFFMVLHWLPVAVYEVPSTTPSFLLSFLGTNGSPMALVTSFLCLASACLVYYPFVKLLLQRQVKES